jgi:dihydropteroate synthase
MSKQLVGILNITPDSFSDGGKYNLPNSAISHLHKLLKDGAKIIDIGAESTRPNAVPISWQEEWSRLENILPKIIEEVQKFNKKNNQNIETSIDSYHFATIEKSYNLGIDIINDVKGLIDDRIINFIAKNKVKTILMHNHPLQINENLLHNQQLGINLQILKWARNKISYLKQKGVDKSQLIFDLGIGFNKNALQSIIILKNINLFRVLGLPLYVGHSKKSFLDAINIEGNRQSKTLEISKFLIKRNIDYLRVHDVAEHYKLLTELSS